MNKSKFFLSLLTAAALCTGSAVAAEESNIGIANFGICLNESKLGLQEQEMVQQLQSQMIALMQDTGKELKEVQDKIKDPEYRDSLSPQADAELLAQEEQLLRMGSQYEMQFQQMMQQAQYKMYQNVLLSIAKASQKIAKENKLKYVINKEACFYSEPELDMTSSVISEMDRLFDLEKAEKKVSSAGDEEESIRMFDDSMPGQAG